MRTPRVANNKRTACAAVSVVLAYSLFTTSPVHCTTKEVSSPSSASFGTADELYREALRASKTDDNAEAERFLNTAIELTLAECVRRNHATVAKNNPPTEVPSTSTDDQGANLSLNTLRRIKSPEEERINIKLSPRIAKSLAKYELLRDQVLRELDKDVSIRDHFAQDWVQQLLQPENNDVVTRAELLFYRGLSNVAAKSPDAERDLNVSLAMAKANPAAQRLLPKIYHALSLNKIRSPKDYPEVETLLQEALRAAETAGAQCDPQDKAALLRALAWTHARQSRHQESEKEALEALQILSRCESSNRVHLSKFKLYNVLAFNKYADRQYKDSMGFLTTAQAEEPLCHAPAKVAQYNKLLMGLNYAATGDKQKAKEILGPIAANADSSWQRREMIDACTFLGNTALDEYSTKDLRFDCIFYEEMNSLPANFAQLESKPSWDLLPSAWFEKALNTQVHLDNDSQKLLPLQYAMERALAEQMDYVGARAAAWNAIKLAESNKATDTTDYLRAVSDSVWFSCMTGNTASEVELQANVQRMENAYQKIKALQNSGPATGYQSLQQQTLERLAQLYYLAGRLSDAKKAMIDAMDLGTDKWTQPHSYFAFDFLAGLSLGLKEYKDAMSFAQKQLSYCANAYQRAEVMTWLANISSTLGDSSATIAFADKGLQNVQEPEAAKQDASKYLTSQLYMYRGEARVNTNKLEDGLKDLQTAADIFKHRYNPANKEETCLQQQFGLFYELEESIKSLKENKGLLSTYESAERGRYWWPKTSRNLAVKVDDASAGIYKRELQNALEKWQQATNNEISFRTASGSDAGNIEFKVVKNNIGTASGVFHPLKYHVNRHNGDAWRDLQSGEVTIGDPRIFSLFPSMDLLNTSLDLKTMQRLAPSPYDRTVVQAIALHEVGHALGLMHSPYPKDLMYWRNQPADKLSDNDTNTIKVYYDLDGPPVRADHALANSKSKSGRR